MHNEIKALGRASKYVPKPPELRLLEQMEMLGIPVWEGGIADQPYIWLQQIGVIRSIRAVYQTDTEAE